MLEPLAVEVQHRVERPLAELVLEHVQRERTLVVDRYHVALQVGELSRGTLYGLVEPQAGGVHVFVSCHLLLGRAGEESQGARQPEHGWLAIACVAPEAPGRVSSERLVKPPFRGLVVTHETVPPLVRHLVHEDVVERAEHGCGAVEVLADEHQLRELDSQTSADGRRLGDAERGVRVAPEAVAEESKSFVRELEPPVRRPLVTREIEVFHRDVVLRGALDPVGSVRDPGEVPHRRRIPARGGGAVGVGQAVHPLTSRTHHHLRGRGDGHLIVGSFTVELADAAQRRRVPTVRVVHGQLREPAGDGIVAVAVAQAVPKLGDPHEEVEAKRGFRSGCQGFGEAYTKERLINGERHRSVVEGDRCHVDGSGATARRNRTGRIRVERQPPLVAGEDGVLAAVCVGVQVQVELAQSGGAAVRVLDRHPAGQRVPEGVQADLDRVAGALLRLRPGGLSPRWRGSAQEGQDHPGRQAPRHGHLSLQAGRRDQVVTGPLALPRARRGDSNKSRDDPEVESRGRKVQDVSGLRIRHGALRGRADSNPALKLPAVPGSQSNPSQCRHCMKDSPASHHDHCNLSAASATKVIVADAEILTRAPMQTRCAKYLNRRPFAVLVNPRVKTDG